MVKCFNNLIGSCSQNGTKAPLSFASRPDLCLVLASESWCALYIFNHRFAGSQLRKAPKLLDAGVCSWFLYHRYELNSGSELIEWLRELLPACCSIVGGFSSMGVVGKLANNVTDGSPSIQHDTCLYVSCEHAPTSDSIHE